MNEITKIILENEMDLILAHKQSMKLGELTGLSLAAQTTFATAVSEVSRTAIGNENEALLTLYVSDKKDKLKYLTAVLEDKRHNFSEKKDLGYNYAQKLVQQISAQVTDAGVRIELNYRLPSTLHIDDLAVEKWRINLNSDPAISPYEEIKRKNKQLIEMADKLRESEQQYKSLTDSLPAVIFSMNKEGEVIYANQWLHDYSAQTIEDINSTKWKHIVHPDDFDSIWEKWLSNVDSPTPVIIPERRLKEAKTGEYRWHTGVSIPMIDENGNVNYWNTFLADIHAQKMIEQTLKDNQQLKEIHAELEEKVKLLNLSNQQLEQFAYVASHDLQEPLRKIGFYSDFLKKKYVHHLPEEATMFFDNLINATGRMKVLIQDVLAYSTVRKDAFTKVNLNTIAAETLHDLEIAIKEKKADITIAELPTIQGNARQLKQLFENLISNALKFSRPDTKPVISISSTIINDNEVLLSFADQGIGFEEKYMDKMFDLFQRLHTRDKYTGTGIGLAICKKIVDLHNGTLTAVGSPENGATFLITLPIS